MNKSVYIILLNWNGWKDTIECLESLQKLEYQNFRIVLLDNGSTDDSIRCIKEWVKGSCHVKSEYVSHQKHIRKIHIVDYNRDTAETGGVDFFESKLQLLPGPTKLVLINNNENLGFAGGCNVGIRYALASRADYVWLLNNDTVVEQDSLTNLVKFLESHNSYSGATGQIRLYDNPSTIWNCGGKLTWYGARRYYYAGSSVDRVQQRGARRITFITGCAALFKSRVFKDTGLLSERFFFGEEDFELSLRLKKRRYKLACCFDAIIYHKVGSSINSLTQRKDLSRLYLYYMNRYINMRSYFSPMVWYLWRLGYLLYIIPMLRFRYKISLPSILSLCKRIFEDSKRMDRIGKNIFEGLMRSTDE